MNLKELWKEFNESPNPTTLKQKCLIGLIVVAVPIMVGIVAYIGTCIYEVV